MGAQRKYPEDWVRKPCTRCAKNKRRSEYYTIRYRDGVRYAGRCKRCEREIQSYAAKKTVTKRDKLNAAKNAERTKLARNFKKLIEACHLLCEHKVSDAQEILNWIQPRKRV